MNEFSDLEADLKQLRPAAPSSELVTRIERTLADAQSATPAGGILPRREPSRLNWFHLGLGVTAAAAAFLLLARPNIERTPTKQPPIATAESATTATALPPVRGLVPDGVTRVVYNTRDEGLLFSGDSDQPMRRKRARSRETLKWKDNQTGASLRVSYPTEEVELVPVAGQ